MEQGGGGWQKVAQLVAQGEKAKAQWAQHVQTNQPVIVKGALDKWFSVPEDGERNGCQPDNESYRSMLWTPRRLEQRIGSSTVRNVFVSTNGRFKYFKMQQGSVPSTRSTQQGEQLRASMTFSASTIAASSASTATTATATTGPLSISASRQVSKASCSSYLDLPEPAVGVAEERPAPFLAAHELLYLYGEPLIPTLEALLPPPSLLADIDLTSKLLWVAPCGNVSPLHYDLSNGILAQLHGRKRVFLLAPSAQHYLLLRPHPIQSIFDRQSRLDDMHRSRLIQEHASSEQDYTRIEAVIGPGEFLYIPYGWWHQVESSEPTVSVSFRWNPYQESVQKAALVRAGCCTMPAAVQEALYTACLSIIPPPVREVLLLRFRQYLTESQDDVHSVTD